MLMNCKAVLLGMEGKTTKDGRPYTIGLFQQGTEVLRSMVKIEPVPNDLQQYKEYDLEIQQSSYNGQIRLDIVGIKKAV